jgi:hypothetical protein
MMFSSCVGWLFWLSDIERLQNQDGVAGHIPVGAPCRSVGVVARAACLARNGKGQGARCAANAASQTMTLKIWALRIPGITAAIVIIAIVSASLMPHLAAVFGLSSAAIY